MSENPGTESVTNLLERVHAGSYVIPYFQRGFEWQPRMVCDLIESILQKYYTGLILLWDLDRQEVKNEEWDPVWGAQLKSSPTSAILDGQQRLASLYYAIYNPKKLFPNRKSYYHFHIDLLKILNSEYEDSLTYDYHNSHAPWKRLKKHMKSWLKDGKVPLAILSEKDPNNPHKRYIDTKEFYRWSEKFVKTNKSEIPDETTPKDVIDVFSDILDYPFVFFPLSDKRKLPDICNIFARVNAKGMKLSTFDLMNAFLYPKGIKLRKDLWENLDNDILKNIDSNMNEYLLKLISLVKQNYCSSNYLYNLIPGQKTRRKKRSGESYYVDVLVKDAKEFKKLWRSACNYAEKARIMIMNTGDGDFGAIKTDFIPNTTIVPVVGAILCEYEGGPDDIDFKSILNQWYWSAVFSEDYSGSSDTVMAKDFRDWKVWINRGKKIPRIRRINKSFIDEIDLTNTKKGSAQYKAVLCILALNGAKDFYKGRIVGSGDYSNENINDHHIFPKSVKKLLLKHSKTFTKYKDSIANRTLLLDETNSRIKNKKPSQYIGEMIEKYKSEKEVQNILKSHLISKKAFMFMKHDNFDEFIIERERTMKRHIIEKLGL